MEFEMKTESTDETESVDFVAYVLAYQMAILWLEPQVKSMTNTKLLLSGKEESHYSQANHLKELEASLKESKVQLRKDIRDRGYVHNSYLKQNAN